MKERFQRARQEQATYANRVVDMFVSRVLEQKWQAWIATREPETPKGNKPLLIVILLVPWRVWEERWQCLNHH
eukprot:1953451-Prorocentrum_lima.AAC.1